MKSIQIKFFTRPGCGLCDEAFEALESLGFPLEIEVIDISDEPELLRRYGTEIPVAIVEGAELFRHRVDPEPVAARLRSAQMRRK